LITTPPHPSYPCAHCTFSTSAADVLAFFFGTDNISFSSTSEGTGVTRSYSSFSQAADEAGLSRLYGGIHWRFDINAANIMGSALSKYVSANFLVPRTSSPPAPSAAPIRFVVEGFSAGDAVGTAGPLAGTRLAPSDFSFQANTASGGLHF